MFWWQWFISFYINHYHQNISVCVDFCFVCVCRQSIAVCFNIFLIPLTAEFVITNILHGECCINHRDSEWDNFGNISSNLHKVELLFGCLVLQCFRFLGWTRSSPVKSEQRLDSVIYLFIYMQYLFFTSVSVKPEFPFWCLTSTLTDTLVWRTYLNISVVLWKYLIQRDWATTTISFLSLSTPIHQFIAFLLPTSLTCTVYLFSFPREEVCLNRF